MRLLRWASELAPDADPRRKRVGVATLTGLQRSELLQPGDQALISAVFGVVVLPGAGGYADRDGRQEGG